METSNDIHLLGLVSDGGVHSHINHIIEVAKIAYSFNKKVFIHIITDGRDVSFNSAEKYIKQINAICNENIIIATISGRYYTMDRDNRWERVQKAYDAMAFAKPKTSKTILDYLANSYENEIFDEFIEPTAFESFEGIE
ncbi:MAG: hypothetical protein ACNI3H_12160 [Halarcobacter ebronensis]